MMISQLIRIFELLRFPGMPADFYYNCAPAQMTPEINAVDHSATLVAPSPSKSCTLVAADPKTSAQSYDSWMIEHPSALGLFDQMMEGVDGKNIVVFLDYDGTLSPIIEDPDCAFMSDEMREAVNEVAKNFPTAIVSGRSRDKVKDFVQLANVYYAGSHGMDIMAPLRQAKNCNGTYNSIPHDKQGQEVLFQPARKFLPAIREMLKALEQQISTIQGARVEDNRFCVSVHFRQVLQEDYGTLEDRVNSVLENYSEFHLTRGKKVLELRPHIEWNKGHALEYLLETLDCSDSNSVLPLYIGDDRTDEDAFKVIQERGRGYPIIVSSITKETKASYSLRNPSEVLSFLLRLAKWRKISSIQDHNTIS